MEEIGGYRLVRRLGSGGMGTVWEALDGDDHRVALKLLHPHISQDPGARTRFEREVGLLHRVRGPRISRVLDAEVDAADAFVVTELIDGLTLDEDVAARGPFTPHELASLARGLWEALHSIHDAGVVHRDLKPSNVMMSATGPVIIDFGIAQVADDVRLTQTGMVTGTPGYLDPEIIDGAQPSPTCDWWAWAAVLVFAATGRQPFGTGPQVAIFQRIHTGAVDVEGLEPDTAAVLRAALVPDSRGRLEPDVVLASLEGRLGERERATALVSLGLDQDGHPAPPIAPSPSPASAAGASEPSGYTRVLPSNAARAPSPAPSSSPERGGTAPVVGYAPSPGVAAPIGGYGPSSGVGGGWNQGGQSYAPSQVPGSGSNWSQGGQSYAPSQVPGGGSNWDQAGTGGVVDPYRVPGGIAPPLQETPEWLVPATGRTGMVASIGALLAVIGMAWPGFALIAFGALLLIAVTAGFGAESLRRTRLRKGLRKGDTTRAVLATPWHLLRALLLAVFLLVVGLGIGWIVLQAAHFVIPELRDGVVGLADHLAMGGGVLLVMLTAWFTPGSERARAGARTALGAIFPFTALRSLLIVLCLALAVVVVALILNGTLTVIDWAPVPEPVWL